MRGAVKTGSALGSRFARKVGAVVGCLATLCSLAALAGWAAPAQAVRSSQRTPEADLATTMSPTRGFTNYGNRVSFTATVTNEGPNTAQNVVVTDSFFTASFVSVSGPGCTPPPITCTTASLAPGHSITITVGLVVRAIHNQLMGNSATATSSTYDPNTSNNTAGGELRSN